MANYTQAGEISNTAIVQTFTAGGSITRGEVVTITPAATSTAAVCSSSDASGNAPYAVAIDTVTSGQPVRCVIYGEVSVVADGNCYKGAYVYGIGGKVATRAAGSGVDKAPILGRVTEGAADTGICTVFVGVY